MEIAFRPLAHDDLPTFRAWLETPHVREWWRDDVDETVETYRKELEEGSTTSFFVIQADSKDVGFIQSYRVEDEPEYHEGVKIDAAVAIDLFVGDASLIGTGFGPRLITAFIEQIVRTRYPAAKYAVTSPNVDNARSIRAFEKAGFVKRHVARFPSEEDPEQVMTLTL